MEAQKQLDILLEFGRIIAKETDLDKLLATMADYAKNLLEADRCSIFIHDAKKDELWTRVAHGVNSEIRIPVNKGVAGVAALSKGVQIVVDAYQDFRFNAEVDKRTGYITKTIIAMPLLSHTNTVIGVFQVLNKKSGNFDRDDIIRLQLISNYASASIDNALLVYEAQKSQIKIINKLASAAEFKDEDTSNHTKRVGEYAALIGRKIGLDHDSIELLRTTAPMHDAGKIGIPDRILLKPGKLTKEEFDTMKTHALIGYNLLHDEDSSLLTTAATIALDHHEKYNGKGYPNGKKGEEISLFGRITAIADVFDALTTKRPYKDPWSFEKTIALFEEERGEHFDPQLVDLFLGSFDEVKEIFNCYKD